MIFSLVRFGLQQACGNCYLLKTLGLDVMRITQSLSLTWVTLEGPHSVECSGLVCFGQDGILINQTH